MSRPHRTALLIEDVSLTRRTIAKMLGRAGLHVIEMDSGVDAEAAVKQHCPDLLVTDLALPDRTGLDVIRGVRAEFPKLPILALTGTSMTNTATKAGADAVLQKPSSIEELTSRVCALLS